MPQRLAASLLIACLVFAVYGKEDEELIPASNYGSNPSQLFPYLQWRDEAVAPLDIYGRELNKRWSTQVRFGKRGSWASQVRFG